MGWRDQIGKEFKYGVNVNMAYNNGGQPYDWSKFVDADLLTAYQNGTKDVYKRQDLYGDQSKGYHRL